MRINTNVSALNTYSRLTAANASKSNSLSKLSSGLRINKAGDDAAGLAISEKMKGQIGGLSQAKSNAQDGISLIQTAEGALNETHSILGRMRDLAVQSSNGTLSNDDRDAIKKEYTALSDEIDRISNTTEFNTKKLLTGEGDDAKSFTFQIGANANQTMSVSINNMSSSALKVKGLDLTQAIDTSDAKAVATAKDKAVATAFEADTTTKYAANGSVDAAAGQTVAELKTAIESAADDTAKATAQKTYDDALATFTASVEGKAAAAATVSGDNNPITKIDEAIKAVSAQRADLGAAQNRLEHTINNLGTTQENLSEANSRIRDVDMAQEMMSFTKSNILSQAATSMLAQANSMPNSVLSLLQG
ncbi:flagellin [Enterococcus casseliflavus]|uniref:flagellin N-terminal helical domain-containing protein n=1 Tax=Enterococcus casseliflavus TaxID=37734 RepID=UPI003D13428F